MQQRLGLARVLIHDPQAPPAGRTGQRPGPARPHRNDGHSPGTPAPGQNHHHFLPHPERTANPLQPRRHHRKGQIDLQRPGPGRARSNVRRPDLLGACRKAIPPPPSTVSRPSPASPKPWPWTARSKSPSPIRDVDPSILADTLVRGGVKFTGLWEDELGLEEVFLRVTRGETQ